MFACVLLGGSKAPDSLPDNVVSTYGMTETGSGVIYDGYPLDGVEVSFRPSTRAGAGMEGEEPGSPAVGPAAGEILLRAPMLFRRYRDGDDGRVDGPRRGAGLVRHR